MIIYLTTCHKNSIVYEPFYGQGHTFRYLQNKYSKELGKEDLDFFSNEATELLLHCNYVMSNPPFSLKVKVSPEHFWHIKFFCGFVNID